MKRQDKYMRDLHVLSLVALRIFFNNETFKASRNNPLSFD